MGYAMRLVMFAVVVIACLSSIALAQNNPNQPPGGTSTTGTTQRQAPIGHRQPNAENLPPEVLQKEKNETSREKEEWDKRLTICRGC